MFHSKNNNDILEKISQYKRKKKEAKRILVPKINSIAYDNTLDKKDNHDFKKIELLLSEKMIYDLSNVSLLFS